MLIRDRVLELLEEGDATVMELANRLGARPNTVSKAAARLREDGDVHIVAYVRQAAVYRHGPGVDAPRPAAPDPVALEEGRQDVRDAKVRGVEMPAYFEIPEMPGRRFFRCEPLRASMSVSSCGARWEKANSTDVDADRFHTCRRCSIGAGHAGRVGHNPSPFRGMTICGRCHRGATRLIGKHLCVSCFNRARELRLGKNGKGTAPVRLAKLDRRSISYRAAGVLKTRLFEESVDTTELVVAVLRDEEHAPQFGWRAPASMGWLLSEAFDRSISDHEAVPVVDGPDVADSVHDAQEQAVTPIVASVAADAVEPAPAPLPDVMESVEADPYKALRDAVEQLEHGLPVSMPTTSLRSAKRMQQQRRQIRVAGTVVSLLQRVGALPPPAPAVAPVPVPSYSPALMSGGTAFG